jgi:hypothetical protein
MLMDHSLFNRGPVQRGQPRLQVLSFRFRVLSIQANYRDRASEVARCGQALMRAGPNPNTPAVLL